MDKAKCANCGKEYTPHPAYRNKTQACDGPNGYCAGVIDGREDARTELLAGEPDALGLMHDRVHKDVGRSRVARTAERPTTKEEVVADPQDELRTLGEACAADEMHDGAPTVGPQAGAPAGCTCMPADEPGVLCDICLCLLVDELRARVAAAESELAEMKGWAKEEESLADRLHREVNELRARAEKAEALAFQWEADEQVTRGLLEARVAELEAALVEARRVEAWEIALMLGYEPSLSADTDTIRKDLSKHVRWMEDRAAKRATDKNKDKPK